MPAALTNLGITEGYTDGENSWGATMNANLRKIDALTQLNLVSAALVTPPGSPATGAAYIVRGDGTGAWDTHDQEIAVYNGTSWEFHTAKEGWVAYDNNTNAFLFFDGSVWVNLTTKLAVGMPFEWQFALGGETQAVAAGNLIKIRAPCNFTAVRIYVSVNEPQESGDIIEFDVLKNGTTMLSTLITVDNTDTTSKAADTPEVVSSANVDDDDIIIVQCTEEGAGTATGAKIRFVGVRR